MARTSPNIFAFDPRAEEAPPGGGRLTRCSEGGARLLFISLARFIDQENAPLRRRGRPLFAAVQAA